MKIIICDGNEKNGGVYKITNTSNGKVYIGSTKYLMRRATSHRRNLLRGTHENAYLQEAFDLNKNDFVFEVIEVVECAKTSVLSVEQKYLDEYHEKWDQCYNIAKYTLFNDVEYHKQFCEAMSKTKKDFYKSEEGLDVLEKFSLARLGKSYEEYYGIERAEEIRKKISEIKLIQMNEPEMIENLRQMYLGVPFEDRFGEERAKEIKERQGKGRKGKCVGKEHPRFRIIENIRLQAPTGEIYTRIEGLVNFCEEHGLKQHHLGELLKGVRIKSYKGWKLLKND